MRRRRAQPTQLLQALPPLAPLAPLVLPSSQPAPDVDLNVDYQSEVAPFLGRCLVSCAVLCCAVLCCAVLCCAVLCCAALRCAALRWLVRCRRLA